MALFTLTYGNLPSREQFDEAWSRQEPRGDLFRFGNDPRLGNCALSQDELWSVLVKTHQEYEDRLCEIEEGDPEKIGSWLSSVLDCLSIEWV